MGVMMKMRNTMNNKLIYLASPYTGTKEKQQERFEQAVDCAGYLLNMGVHIISPIIMCHQIVLSTEMPGDWSFWSKYDFNLLSKCDELWVLCLTDVEKSKGVGEEIKYAKENKVPIKFIKWNPFKGSYTVHKYPCSSLIRRQNG